ncbi:ABC transporter ATP-binding protein [Paracoccaceae bacterium]
MVAGPVRWFLRLLRPRRAALFGALVLMAAEGATMGGLSYLIRPLFDTVFMGSDTRMVPLVALAVAGVFLLRALAGFGHRVILARQAEGLAADQQNALLGHLMTLDLPFFQSNPPGALIERIRGDSMAFRALWPPIFQALGRDVVALLSLLGVALWVDWRWTLIAVVGVPLLALPVAAPQARVRRTSVAARTAAGALSTRLDEIFHGLTTIRLTGSEAGEAERYRLATRDYLRAQLRSETASAGIPALIDIVAAAGFAGVMLYGGYQIMAGQKTVGEFMSFFMAMALVFEPLRRLGSVSGGWAQARASLERMTALLHERPTVQAPAAPRALPVAQGGYRLELEDVSFAYGDQPVLQGLGFVAEPGQVTALVGPSGAGKSTVFHLLTRLADPQSGRVTINGTDLREMDPAELRRAFAVVAQDTALFDETIAANVRLGAADRSDTALQAALSRAQSEEFLARLPLGAETPAGPRGSALSGGQRQRIAIARAILRDAPVLLLDEATSALDSRSEELVAQALAEAGRGRTTLVIAHRLATVRQADKIVVMQAGRVVEQGTHASLLAQGGLYADLHRLQFKD